MAPPRKRSKRRPAQPGRARSQPPDGKPAAGRKPGPGREPEDEAPLEGAAADEVFSDGPPPVLNHPDGPTLEEVDLAAGAPPEDLGTPASAPPEEVAAIVTGELPPADEEDDGMVGPAVGRVPGRSRSTADQLDEQDELLPAARNLEGRSPAKVGGNRVTSFLRASWAELQRVQWPNRRQVGQATAVVLGFVMIAGGYLALADLVASSLVDKFL